MDVGSSPTRPLVNRNLFVSGDCRYMHAMHDQIVFAESEDELSEYNIKELFDFGDAGIGAIVAVPDQITMDNIEHSSLSNYERDKRFELMWNLDSISDDPDEQASLENVRSLHHTPGGNGDGSATAGVVMDSGIDTSHDVFAHTDIVERHNLTPAGGDDAVGHGTATAGQIARLAPNADLIDLRIFGGEGYTTFDIILRAYEWLIQNADKYDFVNMSWGSSDQIPEIDNVHSQLRELGVRDIVSAGNSGGSSGSPATTEDAFSVGACTQYGEMADFSSYDPDRGNPDVTALGQNNVLPRASGTSMGRGLNANWTVASGTSFSAPIVSGLVAKYLSVNPGATPEDVRAAFVESSEDIEGVDIEGAGIVNYLDAMSVNASTNSDGPDATVWEFAGRDSLYVNENILESGKYTIDVEKFRDAFERVE